MAFNVKKCKVMHIGGRNPKYQYSMGGEHLVETEEERDIGVIVTDNLKPWAQCSKVARTAQAVLGQISRAFHYRDRLVFCEAVHSVCLPSPRVQYTSMGSLDMRRTRKC